jgi:hypothetical protein
VSENQIVKVEKPIVFQPVKGRKFPVVSKISRYRKAAVVALAKLYPDEELTPEIIARSVLNNASKTNRAYIRRRLSGVYNELQTMGILWYPIYEQKGQHELIAIKRYTGTDQDRYAFPRYLDLAKKRKEITASKARLLEELARNINEGANE